MAYLNTLICCLMDAGLERTALALDLAVSVAVLRKPLIMMGEG